MHIVTEKHNARRKVIYAVLFILGIALSLAGTYKTVFMGCDIDESYAITLSYRLVMGDHLFKEMWEVHQASSIFMAPFIWVYRRVVGNTIGMVVFLRIVGCVIQFFVALALCHSLSKHISKPASGILALIFYNFSPKYLNVMEFCFLQYLFMTVLLILILYYMKEPKKIFLFGMGVALAGTVLAYPQTVLLVPLQYLILWMLIKEKEGKENSGKKLLCVFFAEAVCGILFLTYVLMNVSFSELLNNIPMILADQSHNMDTVEKILSLLEELWYKCVWLIPIFAFYEIVCAIYRKVKGKEAVYAKEICLFVIWIGWIVPFMLYDERPGICHLDTFYLIFAEFVGIGYLNLRTKKVHEAAKMIRWAELLLLCIVATVGVSSNLSFYANGGILLPVVFLVWVEYMLNLSVEKERADVSKKRRRACMVLLVSACFGFLIARCTLIRFTALQQKTIFSQLHQIGVGTAKDIYVTEREHIQYHSKMEMMQKYVGVENTVLYMGGDAYLYFLIGNQIGVSTTISTPVFDETMVEYYNRYPYKQPDILFIDKYYYNLAELEELGAFWTWLDDEYDFSGAIEEDFAYVVYKK